EGGAGDGAARRRRDRPRPVAAPSRGRDREPPRRSARPGRPRGVLAREYPPGTARGDRRPAAGVLRPRLERLDPHPGPVPARRVRPQRGARGRDDREGEADGRARDGARLSSAPGGRTRATASQPGGDRDRGRRADRPQPRRDSPAFATALRGGASPAAGAEVGAQRGGRAPAPAALARARQQPAQQRLALLAHPLALADRLADQPALAVDEEDGRREADLIALL